MNATDLSLNPEVLVDRDPVDDSVEAGISVFQSGAMEATQVVAQVAANVEQVHAEYEEDAQAVITQVVAEFQAATAELSESGALRSKVAAGVASAKSLIREKLMEPARMLRRARRELSELQDRLPVLRMKMTGNPQKEPDVPLGFRAAITKNWVFIVAIQFVLTMELLIGKWAFSFFSSALISAGIAVVATGSLFYSSSTNLRCYRLRRTQKEALREWESYWMGRPNQPRKAEVFDLPVDISSTETKSFWLFWGGLAILLAGRFGALALQKTEDPTGIFAAIVFVLILVSAHFIKMFSASAEYPADLKAEYIATMTRIEELEEDIEEFRNPHANEEVKTFVGDALARFEELADSLSRQQAEIRANRGVCESLLGEYRDSTKWFESWYSELVRRFMDEADVSMEMEVSYQKPTTSMDIEELLARIGDSPELEDVNVPDDEYGLIQSVWEAVMADLDKEEEAERLRTQRNVLRLNLRPVSAARR